MLSEKGALNETPTIKLLLSVYEQKLTGILYLKKSDILKVLYFNEGKLIWAISNSDKDKLENIMIEGNYSNELELNPFIEENDKDTYGKTLVEKGIITLEELIEITKLQLKQIIISVLRWSDGSFQFTKDLPPEKFLSLELNIVEFISEFIFKAMDISVIWKEIGTMQIELEQNLDEKKLKLYRLSDNQTALLKLFNGEMKLEEIISKYSGVQRETVLKTIYFFLISELLFKKITVSEHLSESENDMNFELPVIETKEVDNTEITNENEFISDNKPIDEKETNSEEYKFNIEEVNNSSNIDIEDTSDIGASENVKTFDGFDELDNRKGNSKKKLFLILVIIILILCAIGLILLKNIDSEVIINNEGNKKIDTIFKNEVKPEIKDLKEDKIAEVSEEKVKQKKKEEIPVKMKPVKKDRSSNFKGKPPIEYYKNGQISVAMDLWKREIRENGIKYTILLEVACEKISVKKAFDNIKSKGKFFVLRRKIGRRNCFKVCWGKFITKKDAADALGFIPKYFFKQESPPEVITIK